MATSSTQATTNTNTQPTEQRHTIGTTFAQLLGATSSVIAMVDNTAKIGEHVTGTLADKAENWRESSKIIDAIEHNKLMKQYADQAQALGLTDI